MTLPNGENGLNPNIELAFATTSDGSIPARSTLDQQTVEALLKQRIKDSGGWSSAHDAAFDSLLGNASTPLFTRVIFTAIKALTNINLTPNISINAIFDGIAAETVQFLDKIIPALDASKVSSGQFSQSLVSGLGDSLTAITSDVELANRIIDLKSAAGSNLMLNPDFGNMLITRFPYSTGVTQGYTLERWRSALSSWKWTQAASKNCGLYFAPTQALDTFLVNEGEQFFIESWVFQGSSNVTTSGEIRLGATFTDTSNTLAPTDVFDAYALSNSAVTKGAWKLLNKTITVPPGYDKAKFWLYASTATPTGNIFYLDDVTVKEVVAAARIGELPAAKITSGTFGGNFIEDLAIGASKLANAAVTNIKVALNAIATGNIQDLAVGNAKVNSDIDGTKIGSGAVAAARIGNLPAAKITSGTFGSNFIEDLAIGASKLANAAVTNIKVALDAIGSGNIQSLAVGNTKVAADLDASKIFSGLLAAARVGELPAAKITSGTFGSNFIEDLAIGATKLANAAVTNIKVALDAIATGNIQNLAVNNTKVNSDIDGTKIGSGAVAAARIGDLPAAKITTGTFGSNFIEDLAIGASKLANAAVTNIKVALDAIATGNIQNLAVNNTKVNSDIDGTKIGSGQVAAARVGDLPTSKITSGTFGSNFIEDLAIGASKLANAAVTNIKVALDAIATGNIQNLAVNNTKVNSDIDGTKIGSGQVAAARIVDLPASKITSGSFAQSRINGLTTNLANKNNITSNPGFENNTLYLGNATYATDPEPVRSGTYSAKMVGTGSGQYTYLSTTDTGILYHAGSPGDVVYVECWIYGANTNTLTASSFNLYVQGFSGAGVNVENQHGGSIVASPALNGVWTKWSGYRELTNADIRTFRVGVYTSCAAGEIYYLDDPVVRVVTDANKINKSLFNSNNPLAAILAGAVPGLQASKITSGTFGSNFIEDLAIGASKLANAAVTNIKVALNAIATGNIQDLAVGNAKVNSDIDGTKIGSGQVAAARVGDLPTSKITSGTFGSNFIEDLAIGATKLANAAVTNIKVALDAIATGNIQNLAVNNTKVNSDIDGTKIGSGQVAAARIVDLPTSKITSGTFGTNFIENLAITAGKIAALAVDNTKVASDIDGTKIGSGQVAAARIANLSTSKITSGTFSGSFIEDLAIGATKLANAAVTNIKVALDAIATGNIQNLAVNNTKVNSDIDGTKIGSGQVAAARVGDLPAGKITSGSFNRSFIDVSDFTNLAAGSDFEGTTYPWTLGSNITIDSTVAYTGTKSLEFTGLTGSASLIGTNQINEGDQLYIELWARRDAAWNGGGSGGSRLRVALNPGNLNWTNVQFNATTIPTVDTWTKLTLVTAAVTPVQAATYKTVTATIFCTDATAGNLWIDDIVIRRINGSEVIKDNAIVSAKIANLAVGNSKVAADLDGTKITAGSVAEARIANLSAAKITSGTFGNSFIANLAIDASKLADAAVTNIKVALNAIATGNIQNLAINNTKVDSDIDGTKIGSGQVAAARIVDLPTSKITSGTFGSNFIEDLAIGASKLANAAVTNIKVALDAIGTGNIQNLAVSNTKVNTDIDGTKIGSGLVAEARVQNLTSTITTANTAQGLASTLLSTGGNLIPNGGFENTSFFLSAVQGSYSTEQALSGTRSLKLISNASSAYGYITSNTTALVRVPVSVGDILYVEYFVRGAVSPPTTNVQTTGGTNGIRMVISFRNAANGVTGSSVITQTASTALNGVWTKVSGYTTAAPADTVGFYAYLELFSPVASGETYYFDEVIIRRTAKVPAGGITANEIAALAVTNAKIATGAIGTANIQSSAITANELAALAVTNPAIALNAIATGNIQNLAVGNAKINSDLDGTKITAGSVAEARIANLSAAKITSGTFGSSFIENLAITAGKLADAAVTNIKVALDAIATGNIQNLAVGNAKVAADLDGTKITAGSVAEARIANLSAAKITSGTFGNARIATDAIATGNIQNLAVGNAKVNSDIDGTKISSGLVAEARVQNLTAARTDVQNTFNKLAGVLTNGEDSVTGSVIDNVVSALLKTYNTLQDHSRDIQDLKSEQSAAQVKGTSYQINFSSYSNGAFSTTPAAGTDTFFVIYSGTGGTSSMGVQGGVGQWFNTNNVDRNATIIWNKSTNTDFQILNGTMTTPPQQPAGGAGTPKFHAIGRVNSTGNTYVWARAYCDGFLSFKGEIGCTVAGTETVWATNIPLTWSLDMRFVLGVGTNARQYQIYSGSTLVWTHTESGTANVNYTTKNSTSAVQSTLGASNRQWGALAQIRGGTNGPYHSGKLSGASVADNQSPAVKGSVARMYKNAGTQNYNGANADNVLTTFWDTVEYESPDIDADTATGTFRVTESKPYIISARVRLTSGVSSTCRLVLQRSTDNGATYPVAQHGIATSNCEGIGDSWVQYLNAGDRVRISARQSGINAGSILGSGQSETFFSITGAG